MPDTPVDDVGAGEGLGRRENAVLMPRTTGFGEPAAMVAVMQAMPADPVGGE